MKELELRIYIKGMHYIYFFYEQQGPSCGMFVSFLYFCIFVLNIVATHPYYRTCFTYYANHVYVLGFQSLVIDIINLYFYHTTKVKSCISFL